MRQETVKGLEMELFGISDLPEADQGAWASLTALFQAEFYTEATLLGILEYEAEIEVIEVVPDAARNLRRGLQEDSVTVVYNQVMTYRTTDPDVTPDTVAIQPFATPASRDDYVTELNDSNQGVLSDITIVSEVTVREREPTPSPTIAPTIKKDPTNAPTKAPTKAPTNEDADDGLSTGAIIGIAVGGGVGLIGLLLFCFFKSGSHSGDYHSSDDPPPNVSIKPAGDEVSTLAPPPRRSGGPATSNESLAGYGDQR
jgi:hypothetical protein